MKTFVRGMHYVWASPATAIGLPFVAAACLTGGGAGVHNGILEAYGGLLSWLLRRCVPLVGGAQALTLGHVVLGQTREILAESRDHETIHVRQYERWGPFFLPAYLSASLFLLLAGRNFYLDNPFEREAFFRTSGK